MTSKTFKVSFGTGNAAFDGTPAYEIARLLREIADRVEDGARQGTLNDVNGNLVGDFHLGDFK